MTGVNLDVCEQTGFVKEGRQTLPLYIDVTRIAYWNRAPAGICRVERAIATWASDFFHSQVHYIVWHKDTHKYVEISRNELVKCGFGSLGLPNLSRYAVETCAPAGSLLLVAGNQWFAGRQYASYVLSFVREHRLRLVTIIHDVIPHKFHYLFDQRGAALFWEMCIRMVEGSAFVLADSRCTARDLGTGMSQAGLVAPAVIPIRLGDDFSSESHARVEADRAVVSLAENRSFILCVCTVGRMKNHALLYTVWKKLLQEHNPEDVPSLFLVGHVEPELKRFAESVKTDISTKEHIHFFQGLGDATVDFLYEKCLFCVYPTRYEGWGLPVGECLAHGKICVASDVASIPEIAPEFTDLLDPRDYKAWLERIRRYIFDEDVRKKREKAIAAYKPTSWKTVAEDCCRILSQRDYPAPQWPFLSPGQTVCEFGRSDRWSYLGKGWEERDGRIRISGDAASLLFRLRMRGLPVAVRIEFQGRDPGVELETLVNGKYLQSISIRNKSEVARIILPPQPMDGDGVSDIQLTFKNPAEAITSGCGKLTSPYLSTLAIEACGHDETNLFLNIDKIDRICPSLARTFRILAHERADLEEMLAAQHGNEAALLWAWRYGIGEDTRIGKNFREILEALRKLHRVRHDHALIPGYSELIHRIHSYRSDLQDMDIGTVSGQERVVQWFASCGRHEYNLHDPAFAQLPDVLQA